MLDVGDMPDNTLGLPHGSVSYLRGEELGYIRIEPKAIGWCGPSPTNGLKGLKFEVSEPGAIGSGGPSLTNGLKFEISEPRAIGSGGPHSPMV